MQALDFFVTKCGDTVTFYVGEQNHKPIYRIIQDSQYSSFSFYDGEDLEIAKNFFYELLLAFKNLSAAENFLNKAIRYTEEIEDPKHLQEHKSAPLFLGNNDYSF